MIEILFKITKLIAALSLQLLSFSLLIWGFNLRPHFSAMNIALFCGVCLLVYLFVSYSLSLFKQVFNQKKTIHNPDVLDEDEILKHKNHD